MKPLLWPQPDPAKRYFPLPNEIFRQDITACEFAILAYLFSRAARKLSPPNIMTVIANLCVSRNTMKKYVRRLQERGLISVEHRSRFLPGILSVRDGIALTDQLKLRVGQFFPMPNCVFGFGLSVGELAVYGYLMFRENRETYECWPSYRTIGAALHLSKNTVLKYVHRLEDKGYIVTEPTTVQRKDGTRWNGNLKYTVRPVRELIDQWNAEELARAERERLRHRAERCAARYPGLTFTARNAEHRQAP